MLSRIYMYLSMILTHFKAMEINFDNVCFFDCETTGLPPKGAKWDVDYNDFPNIVQLAWSVNGHNNNYIVYPDGWLIPEESIKVHGITAQRAYEEGVKFEVVAEAFVEDCLNSNLLVGHNIYFDTSVIKAMILRVLGQDWYDRHSVECALYKGKRFDTMRSTIKFVGARYADGKRGKFPSLAELHEKLFPGKVFGAHDAMEDVKAVMRCYKALIEMRIIDEPVPEPMISEDVCLELLNVSKNDF